jgi:MinD-like ATPase involved in chromosome partitioning or flagellar assembly
MEQQVFNFIVQILVQMKVAPSQIGEDTDIIFDLNLGVSGIDRLFSLIEKRFQLNTALMFNKEIATLKGLSNYVGRNA